MYKRQIYLCLLAAAGVMSAGVAQAADEEALAKSKNCLSCHAVDKKVVGPSYKDVAKKYTAKDEPMLAKKVIEGGKDLDITDHVPDGSSSAKALAAMKLAEPGFTVGPFLQGARGAYEMILMAFEKGELDRIRPFLSDEVESSFAEVVADREKKGLTVESNFFGLKEMVLHEATFDQTSGFGEITIRFVGELTSVVRDKSGEIVEGAREVVAVLPQQADATCRIERDYDPSIPPLWGDADRLIQAMLNVVRNAVQALGQCGVITLRSRVQRQYTIGAKRHKLVARLDIADDGPGIPPDQQEQIFYPMISGRPDGTGLGLSIAQSIVNQHGGLIECASRPGETVFTLLLPLGKPG